MPSLASPIAQGLSLIHIFQTASALNYQTVITPVLEAHAGFNNGYYVLPLLTFVTQWILARMQTKQQAMTTGSVSGSNFMMELLMPLMIAWFAMTTGALFLSLIHIFGLSLGILAHQKIDSLSRQ